MGIFRKKEKKIKPTHNEFAGFTGDYKVVTGVSYVIMIGLCILACGFVFEKQIQSPAI
jgi:ATP/ADP translocase